MTEWLYSSHVLAWLFAMSIGGFVGSLIVVPWILVRLPPHYFDERHPRTWLKDHHPWLRALAIALKNVLGIGFVLAGIAMLVLPGQGMLTILIGLSFMDFPGKRALERKIISVPMVLHTVNRLRERFGHPSLVVYPHCHIGPEPPPASGSQDKDGKAAGV